MEWYASENLEEAYTSTKDFLLPFDKGRWARMAIVVLLTGGLGFGSFSNIFSNIPSGSTPSSISTAGAPAESGSLTGAVTGMASMEPVVISLAVFFLLIILGFMYVSSVFEFVFYKSIREQEVEIRKYFSSFYHGGFHYFLFQFALMTALLSVILLVVGLFFINPVVGFVSVLAGIPLLLAVVVTGGLVHDLVIPQMIDSGDGLIESSKAVWPDVKEERKQVGVYLILKLVVNMAASIASGILILFSILLLSLVFGIPTFVLLKVFKPLAIILAILGVLAWFAMMLLIRVPFDTYLYYYYIHMYEDLVR